MILRNLFLASALLLSAQQVSAKTLIVSDVDDTIKMTDVLGSKTQIVISGLIKEKAFAGMSELYNKMNNADTDIYYVSGSPSYIKFRIVDFLEENNFPQKNNILLKNRIKDDTYAFKVGAIKELIKKLNPDKIILIGDDTEHDPHVYETISNENPGLVEGIYIRSIQNNQSETFLKTFISPVEIAGYESLAGRLEEKELAGISAGFINQTYKSGIALKKRYCPKTGRESLEELKNKLSADSTAVLENTQQKIIKSCK